MRRCAACVTRLCAACVRRGTCRAMCCCAWQAAARGWVATTHSCGHTQLEAGATVEVVLVTRGPTATEPLALLTEGFVGPFGPRKVAFKDGANAVCLGTCRRHRQSQCGDLTAPDVEMGLALTYANGMCVPVTGI